jgi:hypothetical protein
VLVVGVAVAFRKLPQVMAVLAVATLTKLEGRDPAPQAKVMRVVAPETSVVVVVVAVLVVLVRVAQAVVSVVTVGQVLLHLSRVQP